MTIDRYIYPWTIAYVTRILGLIDRWDITRYMALVLLLESMAAPDPSVIDTVAPSDGEASGE